MSYHRVLPRPSALSNEDLATRWAAGADFLKSARIMTNERSNSAYLKNGQIPASSTADSDPQKSFITTPEPENQDAISSPEHRESVPEQDNRDPAPARVRKSAPSNIDTWQGETPSQICLCQPDPKVPRPRNAFILYRQHHQASIVAQNPGLPNPEISKVIGDHWRASPPEVKEHWKLLAEEEKIRHQKQYPDYRYQPRRSGRAGSLAELAQSGGSSASEHSRCAKCGGKSMGSANAMNPSSSISAQGSPAVPQNNRDNIHAMAPPPATSTVASGRFMRSLASPPDRDASIQSYRFARPQSAQVLPLSSPRHIKRPAEFEMSPVSPESKRRRIPTVSFAQTRGSQGPQTPFPIPPPQHRRPSLPRPDFMGGALPSPISTGFPVRLGSGQLQQRSDSLRLPPLHTPSTAALHTRSGSNDTQQETSLDAMIQSIPLLNKVRLLGRISAPLPRETRISRSTNSLKGRGRGPVIAIDSADSIALKQIVDALERSLKTEYDMKTFSTPKFTNSRAPSLQSYIRLIDQYHDLSHDVAAHVSNAIGIGEPDSAGTPSVAHQLSAVELNAEDRDAMDMTSESPISPKSFPTLQASMEETRNESGDVEGGSGTIKPATLPIALLPAWQLTHTDFFATNAPITDSYSAMDHWQWHATLWRGVLGADATIAVQNTNLEEQSSPPGTATSGMSGVAGGGDQNKPPAKVAIGSKGDKSAANGVDMRLEDFRAVVLQPGEKGIIPEGSLRRVAFEISEWVRAWYEQEGA